MSCGFQAFAVLEFELTDFGTCFFNQLDYPSLLAYPRPYQ
jgi:hypothetical protein